MKIVSKSAEVAGKTITLEVGRFAQQATSAVFAKCGETSLLATVVLGKEDLKKDYFPLSVEYQERLYAGGRIKGSRWVKREGRPTDAEILSARLIDRSIRPLFPQSFKNEVQVIITVLSVDNVNDPDILGAVATSAAIAISPIPWAGPVGVTRVGSKEEGLDVVVTSTDKVIDMIEAGANQIPEERILEALKTGFESNQEVIKLIKDLVSEVGKDKLVIATPESNSQLVTDIENKAKEMIAEYITNSSTHEGNSLADIAAQLSEGLDAASVAQIPAILEKLTYKILRQNILEKSHRPDGRKLDEIRPLSIEVGILPRVHGSAMFQRGQTQALTITTLGAPSLSQSLESAEGEETKRYMHHYNFPPFSTGETGRVGSPGRREIGHGALAEKGLLPVIPAETEFPYAIRVVSEILSSNGSTSMASTCGSTLSLMDAGVPLKAPVAGISTGLVMDGDKYVLLTDIIGMEDHYTDMDFKVAGTQTGITAIQLDVKIPGLTLEICEETLKRAKVARMQILEAMLKVIPDPRPSLSQYAPKINVVTIPVDKIGELIGPGGKVIKKLMADTGTTIDVNDDGSVFVSGTDQDGVNNAIGWIGSLGQEAKPGEIYTGTVARIQPFGAFVNILPGKDGLVHVSQMAQGFVADPNQIVHEGDKVKVWVTEIDSQGRINLSMLFDEAGQPLVKAREERATAPRREDRGPFRAPMRRDDRPRRRF